MKRRISDPWLLSILGIVERQPTDAFKAKLFSFTEKNLGSMNKFFKKTQGVAKFKSNNDFLPNSVRQCIGPKLDVHKDLINDKESKKDLNGWKDEIFHLREPWPK